MIDENRQLVLIPTGGDGMISVIRLSPEPEVIATIPTAEYAHTPAIDEATGAIYLPSAKYGPAPAEGGPPSCGSFAALVVKPQ